MCHRHTTHFSACHHAVTSGVLECPILHLRPELCQNTFSTCSIASECPACIEGRGEEQARAAHSAASGWDDVSEVAPLRRPSSSMLEKPETVTSKSSTRGLVTTTVTPRGKAVAATSKRDQRSTESAASSARDSRRRLTTKSTNVRPTPRAPSIPARSSSAKPTTQKSSVADAVSRTPRAPSSSRSATSNLAGRQVTTSGPKKPLDRREQGIERQPSKSLKRGGPSSTSGVGSRQAASTVGSRVASRLPPGSSVPLRPKPEKAPSSASSGRAVAKAPKLKLSKVSLNSNDSSQSRDRDNRESSQLRHKSSDSSQPKSKGIEDRRLQRRDSEKGRLQRDDLHSSRPHRKSSVSSLSPERGGSSDANRRASAAHGDSNQLKRKSSSSSSRTSHKTSNDNGPPRKTNSENPLNRKTTSSRLTLSSVARSIAAKSTSILAAKSVFSLHATKSTPDLSSKSSAGGGAMKNKSGSPLGFMRPWRQAGRPLVPHRPLSTSDWIEPMPLRADYEAALRGAEESGVFGVSGSPGEVSNGVWRLSRGGGKGVKGGDVCEMASMGPHVNVANARGDESVVGGSLISLPRADNAAAQVRRRASIGSGISRSSPAAAKTLKTSASTAAPHLRTAPSPIVTPPRDMPPSDAQSRPAPAPPTARRGSLGNTPNTAVSPSHSRHHAESQGSTTSGQAPRRRECGGTAAVLAAGHAAQRRRGAGSGHSDG